MDPCKHCITLLSKCKLRNGLGPLNVFFNIASILLYEMSLKLHIGCILKYYILCNTYGGVHNNFK